MAFVRRKQTISIGQVMRQKAGRKNANAFGDKCYADYKNIEVLRKYLNRFYKIESNRRTGLNSRCQRALATAVKRARFMALLPFTIGHTK
jgi:small subunit ribosomal protein S18